MEKNLIIENKKVLKTLMSELPKKSGYAENISERLEKKGISVNKMQVYQTMSSKSYFNYDIAKEIKEYHTETIEKLNETLRIISK